MTKRQEIKHTYWSALRKKDWWSLHWVRELRLETDESLTLVPKMLEKAWSPAWRIQCEVQDWGTSGAHQSCPEHASRRGLCSMRSPLLLNPIPSLLSLFSLSCPPSWFLFSCLALFYPLLLCNILFKSPLYVFFIQFYPLQSFVLLLREEAFKRKGHVKDS